MGENCTPPERENTVFSEDYIREDKYGSSLPPR